MKLAELTFLDDGKTFFINPQHVVAVMGEERRSSTADAKTFRGSKIFTIIGQTFVAKETPEEVCAAINE